MTSTKIPDKTRPYTREARQIIGVVGLLLDDSVESVMAQARCSLAQTDKWSNCLGYLNSSVIVNHESEQHFPVITVR